MTGKASQRIGLIASSAGFALIAAAAAQAVVDQAKRLPLAPPTAAEAALSRPKAQQVWAATEHDLQVRLASDRPLEIGEVWATRNLRICGYANARSSAVDDMTPFFTAHGQLRLRGDNVFQFVLAWQDCLRDRWVELNLGTEQTGECGSKRFRASVLGRKICPERDLIFALTP